MATRNCPDLERSPTLRPASAPIGIPMSLGARMSATSSRDRIKRFTPRLGTTSDTPLREPHQKAYDSGKFGFPEPVRELDPEPVPELDTELDPAPSARGLSNADHHPTESPRRRRKTIPAEDTGLRCRSQWTDSSSSLHRAGHRLRGVPSRGHPVGSAAVRAYQTRTKLSFANRFQQCDGNVDSPAYAPQDVSHSTPPLAGNSPCRLKRIKDRPCSLSPLSSP